MGTEQRTKSMNHKAKKRFADMTDKEKKAHRGRRSNTKSAKVQRDHVRPKYVPVEIKSSVANSNDSFSCFLQVACKLKHKSPTE